MAEKEHISPQKECVKSTQHSIYTRRCFATGELCSKQTNVHKEREKLHEEKTINAFVVMNFSGMSDVVYKWKMERFIESLKQYLFLDCEGHQIACVERGEMPAQPAVGEWVRVEKINVIRADSNAASNYIICSRICQQIQIADLIVVDVSVENTNVFYEFGLAAAFGKLILPICYNESFYEMKVPEKARMLLEKKRQEYASATDRERKHKYVELEKLRKRIEHHIDCYPWRRKLFENYGIRYRSPGSQVRYGLFDDVTNEIYGFSDTRYGMFPYDAVIESAGEPQTLGKDIKDWHGEFGYRKVGYLVYDRLRASYHTKVSDRTPLASDKGRDTESTAGDYNTLVLYTMDGILNENQAGLCIINFYKNMTYQLQAEFCFCGDRVAVLGQSNVISDDPKDTKIEKMLLYNVGDIIRIGMNQATYEAHQRQIKTDDFLFTSGLAEYVGEEPDEKKQPAEYAEWKKRKAWADETTRSVKGYIRNRCVPLLPDEPIYVKQYTKGIQKHLFDVNELEKRKDYFDHKHFFTMFHMMLYTLRYANEVVVDISGNSLQALFWLGVAHGCDAPAITVRHAPTAEELDRLGGAEAPKERRIFDVAGLWTAVLNSNDVKSFYDQLIMTQIGIDQHNRLTLPDIDILRDEFADMFYVTWKNDCDKQKENYEEFWLKKRTEEGKRLESYYRNCFWRRMLRYNELHLYISQYKGSETKDKQPLVLEISWDVNAASELNHYLSKRTVIGQYTLHEIKKNKPDPDARSRNFIGIGGKACPLDSEAEKPGLTLPQEISNRKNVDGALWQVFKPEAPCPDNLPCMRSVRGFRLSDNSREVYAQFPKLECVNIPEKIKCPYREEKLAPENGKASETANQLHFTLPNDGKERLSGCELEAGNNRYQQLAQMLLWREVTGKERSDVKFWVSLNGVSGPATLALTALLVDDKQKKNLFTRKDKKDKKRLITWCETPLKDIQLEIRKNMLDRYAAVLKREMGIGEQNQQDKEQYEQYNQLYRITSTYLSTILYRYFLPFLSKADEVRIENSMHAFLTTISAADGDYFEEIGQLSEKVEAALNEVITTVRGVDILYTVTVESEGNEEDDRWPVDIKQLRKPVEINCLYVNKSEQKKE